MGRQRKMIAARTWRNKFFLRLQLNDFKPIVFDRDNTPLFYNINLDKNNFRL